jgi:hypothetical protein
MNARLPNGQGKKNPEIVFIFWFDESLRQAESFFAKQTTQLRYY